MTFVLAILVPYAALAVFYLGVAYRVIKWARSPVPFRIPTTCGQQKSLSWIRASRLENPSTTAAVVIRVLVEALFFRSLLRDERADRQQKHLYYSPTRVLWVGALLFHWSLLVVLLRHLRLFLNPVPCVVAKLQAVDGLFEVGMPVLYVSDVLLLVSLAFLLARRILLKPLRYLSLPTDYFALALLLSIAATGAAMRYLSRMDVAAVKHYAIGLATFHPTLPSNLGPIFYLHILLVSTLLIYFPFSKLMHMGGMFLSPTHNLANTSRMRRHINPWNPPVEVHTYEQWEDEFRSKMIGAGMPVEKH